MQEHQRQEWHEVIVDELEREHRLKKCIRHFVRVISREVNPEVERQYNDKAASKDKDGNEDALTHNQLLHLAVQFICERPAYRVDQKG